jgi:hypothetical protein
MGKMGSPAKFASELLYTICHTNAAPHLQHRINQQWQTTAKTASLKSAS